MPDSCARREGGRILIDGVKMKEQAKGGGVASRPERYLAFSILLLAMGTTITIVQYKVPSILRPADGELRNVAPSRLVAHVRVHRGRDLPLHPRWVACEESGPEACFDARLRGHRPRQRCRRAGREFSRPDRVAAHRGHRVRARHRCGTSCNREVRLARQPRNRERNLGPLDLPGFSHRVHGDPGRIRGPRDEGNVASPTPRSSPSPPWPLPYSCGR